MSDEVEIVEVRVKVPGVAVQVPVSIRQHHLRGEYAAMIGSSVVFDQSLEVAVCKAIADHGGNLQKWARSA